MIDRIDEPAMKDADTVAKELARPVNLTNASPRLFKLALVVETRLSLKRSTRPPMRRSKENVYRSQSTGFAKITTYGIEKPGKHSAKLKHGVT